MQTSRLHVAFDLDMKVVRTKYLHTNLSENFI